MRGLDTKVLVRNLTADEPRQCAAAERIIQECLRNEEPIYLTDRDLRQVPGFSLIA